MIGKHLKALRLERQEENKEKYSLRAVSERWGRANSYLSDIENELIKNPKNEQIIKLLVDGYDMKPSEAKDWLSQYKILDDLKIASDPKKVHINVGNIIYDGQQAINQTFNN